ncbi:hypothetical protein AJ87_14135 [Rhizobium yanglingense]|nr:hypothetical protein AJ87_14135 [Rhizobium yanglingense]
MRNGDRIRQPSNQKTDLQAVACESLALPRFADRPLMMSEEIKANECCTNPTTATPATPITGITAAL